MLAGALMLALGAAPAAAQRSVEFETGSHIAIPTRARIPEEGEKSRADRARIVMAQFARCISDRERAKVARAVSLPYGDDFIRAAQGLAVNECLSEGMIRFKPIAIRGPLFTELFRRRTLAEAAGDRWDVPAPRISFAAAEVVSDDVRGHLVVLQLGDCVVRADEAGARKVVLAPTASKQQDEAVRQLVPKIGACVQQGSTIKLGKQTIEAMLAEVLYRGVEPTAAPATPAEKK